MKKVAIIGKNSYIGSHIRDRFQEDDGYEAFEVEAQDGAWHDVDFSDVDVVVQVAGIVHRPDVTDWHLYKSVNVDLPVEIAKEAKACGVKQFVFLSTMGVFGVDKRLSPNVIDADTKPNPKSMYGQSKYDAEQLLMELSDEEFKVIIVRPPNVYGKGCRGGYITGFASVVRKLPLIPNAYNNVHQSVIYIDNLSEFIFQATVRDLSGVFMPQDDKAVSACELMLAIASGLGLNRRASKFLGLFVPLVSWTSIAKKAYGGLEYSKELSDIKGIDYIRVPFDEAIQITVSGDD
ncbi:UDP-glucose 4-epimerase [Pseudobutyrivibrio sp. YE44]|uniref:NAD-dependent epimerase/dehydratase family protein n=1 Tax=Pseudobutyrivibrio sp. YE44 TaxID=1520802 RepID=UPI0008840CE1|nr:NAD-dependent epimerase/dehydratase family protein [Pseudobutyrivibrio sp. YE44]SDB54361.1 UDP-glucose 4-epimerase [Pseudobutyrivibrio sp. YE44]